MNRQRQHWRVLAYCVGAVVVAAMVALLILSIDAARHGHHDRLCFGVPERIHKCPTTTHQPD